MTPTGPTRHLGLDLGGTNIKWAVVEHDAATAGESSTATRSRRRPADRAGRRVVARARRMGGEAIAPLAGRDDARDRRPRAVRPGSRHDPLPRQLPGRLGRACPSPARSAARSALPAFLINDARAFGLAELRLGAARGASSMIGLTLGTGRRRRDRDRRPRRPGSRRHGRRDRPPDDRPGRPLVRLRQPRLPRGVRPGRPDRRRLRDGHRRGGASSRARAGDARALDGLAAGRALPRASGSPTWSPWSSPDRVVIGGGIAAAGDLLLEPIRDELRRRVRTTSLDDGRDRDRRARDVGGRDRRGHPRRRGGRARGRAAADRRGPTGRGPMTEAALPAAVPPDRAGPARADRDAAARASDCRPTPSCAPSSA